MAERLYVLPLVDGLPMYLSGLAARQQLIRWFGTDPPSCLVCADDMVEIEHGCTEDPDAMTLPRLEHIDGEIGDAFPVVRGRVLADLDENAAGCRRVHKRDLRSPGAHAGLLVYEADAV